MQQYITQLIQDLSAAKGKHPTTPDYKLLHPNHPAADPEYEGELDHLIEWEMGSSYTMSDLFGIDGHVFPSAEQLSEEQQKDIIDAILDLWLSFNIAADFPAVVPVTTLYNVLVNRWKAKPVNYMSVGTLHLEFCHYDPTECPWGMEYCQCKDLW